MIDTHQWISIVEQLKKSGNMPLFSMLQDSEAFLSRNRFYIALPVKVNAHKASLSRADNLRILKQLIDGALNQNLIVSILTSIEKEQLLLSASADCDTASVATANLSQPAPVQSTPVQPAHDQSAPAQSTPGQSSSNRIDELAAAFREKLDIPVNLHP